MLRVLLASIFFSGAASAQVFKWVDADGRTQFSDRPQPSAEIVNLPGTASARSADQSVTTDGALQAAELGPYTEFEIVSPEPNQTLRSAQDNVPIGLVLVPSLIAGHLLEFVVDGTSIAVDKSAGTQINLTGVAYGSHQTQAQIRDDRGIIVARTRPVSFQLRKPIPPGVIP
jgi:hypothetical protein